MPKLDHKNVDVPAACLGWLVGIGILLGFGIYPAQAQLGPCGSLQHTHTRCEGPKWTLPTPETIREFTGQQRRGDNLGGLPDVSHVRPFQRRLEEDPGAALVMPPIDGVRDFLNRRDPERAIYPLYLPPRHQPSLGNR